MLLEWPKCLLGIFCTMLWKNLNELTGLLVSQLVSLFCFCFCFCFCFDASWLLHAGFLQLWRVGDVSCCGSVLLNVVASLVAEPRSQIMHTSVVAAHGLQSMRLVGGHMGLVAPWHVKSSQTRDQTCTPCFGRQIFNHWVTRKVPEWTFWATQCISI